VEPVPHLRPRRPAGRVAGDYILAHFKDRKIAIVHDKTTYGQGLPTWPKATINPRRNEGSALRRRQPPATRTSPRWCEDQGSAPPSSTGRRALHRCHDPAAVARSRRAAQIIGGDGIADDEFAAIAGPGAEGTLMTSSADPRRRPEAQAVLARFRVRNVQPQAYTLYSYAAVEIIKQARGRELARSAHGSRR